MLNHSAPLANIFKIDVQQTLTCSAQVVGTDNSPAHTCSEVTQQNTPVIGLQLAILGNTIVDIINRNMITTVKADCTECKNKNIDKSKTETYTSLPEVILIQMVRFSVIRTPERIINKKNYIRN